MTTPAQFGKLGFNPSLIEEGMPVLGTGSESRQVIPEIQAVIVVLTNSTSQGDTADWVAQTIFQTVLGLDSPLDLQPIAERAASGWRSTHKTMADALESRRNPGTGAPRYDKLVGTYWHTTGEVSLHVYEDGGSLKFNIGGNPSQEHVLSHYHCDSFIFLPPADERIRRGLFHYSTEAWLLHFESDSGEGFRRIRWKVDAQIPIGEVFTRSQSGFIEVSRKRLRLDDNVFSRH